MFTLNSPWFELVKTGQKIYEGRRHTEKIASINPGQVLVITHHTDNSTKPYEVVVEEVLHFPTFEVALNTLTIDQVLPIANITINQGVEIYKKYVSLPTQERDGVVMIKIKVNSTCSSVKNDSYKN